MGERDVTEENERGRKGGPSDVVAMDGKIVPPPITPQNQNLETTTLNIKNVKNL